jgi:hypothetical protein
LGDNIKKEFELKTYIDSEFKRIFDVFITALKSNFNISKKTSLLIDKLTNADLKIYVQEQAYHGPW